MDTQIVVDLMQESFKTALLLALPPLLAAMVVGLAVAVFQSVTSIQEQTLVLVPKMLAVVLTIILGFSWMLGVVIHFTVRLYSDIPRMIG